MGSGWLMRLLGGRSLAGQITELERSVARLVREQAKANLEWENTNQARAETDAAFSRALQRLEEALQRRYQLDAALRDEGRRAGRQEVLAEAVQGMLALLDGLHRAIQAAGRSQAGAGPAPGAAGPTTAPWLAGLQALHRRGEETLAAWDIEPTSAPGARFDPDLHEAVTVVLGNAAGEPVIDVTGEPVIKEEVLRGYRCGPQILRMAKVVVIRNDSADRDRPGDHQFGGGGDGTGWPAQDPGHGG